MHRFSVGISLTARMWPEPAKHGGQCRLLPLLTEPPCPAPGLDSASWGLSLLCNVGTGALRTKRQQACTTTTQPSSGAGWPLRMQHPLHPRRYPLTAKKNPKFVPARRFQAMSGNPSDRGGGHPRGSMSHPQRPSWARADGTSLGLHHGPANLSYRRQAGRALARAREERA